MKKFISITFLVLFAAAQFLSPQPARAAGTTYYVAKTGNDSNPGTASQPWRTIQKAANTAVAGDTVYVRAGTYNEKVIVKNSGAPGAYITFSAYSGETPIIDVSGISMNNYFEGGFTVYEKNYIQLLGFKVINSTRGFGIVCYASDHCIVKNNSTYNTYMSGIAVRSSVNVTVDHNDVALANNNGEQEMITISGSGFVTVTNNRVHDGGPGTNGGEGIDIKDGSHDVLVQANEIYNVPRIGIYVDAYSKHTYNITVDSNIVHHAERSGIAIAAEHGGLLEDIFITNNLVYRNGNVGIVVGAWVSGYTHPIRDVRIVNNTVFDNGTDASLGGGGIKVENGDFSNILIRNNIVSDNAYYTIELLESPAQVTITHNLIDGYRGRSSETRGTDYIEADPLFADGASFDFNLLAESPAIDSGTALLAPDHDFVGNPRPVVDIGAYEFAGTEVEPPPSSTVFFSENFDRRLTGWVKTGRISLYSGVPHNGARSLMLRGNASVARPISTLGYSDIQLTIYLGAKYYEASENLSLAWWDGANWQTLAVIADGAPEENALLNPLTFSLPASASDLAAFRIRILQTSADLNDFAYIDDIQISGTPK